MEANARARKQKVDPEKAVGWPPCQSTGCRTRGWGAVLRMALTCGRNTGATTEAGTGTVDLRGSDSLRRPAAAEVWAGGASPPGGLDVAGTPSAGTLSAGALRGDKMGDMCTSPLPPLPPL